MPEAGYYRFPTIHDDTVIFVSEDDLWTVALGLLAALRLSGQEALRAEVRELLLAHGLPVTLSGADPEAVVMATARDKKRTGQDRVPFVLLEAPGRPLAGQSVPDRDVMLAVRELTPR